MQKHKYNTFSFLSVGVNIKKTIADNHLEFNIGF